MFARTVKFALLSILLITYTSGSQSQELYEGEFPEDPYEQLLYRSGYGYVNYGFEGYKRYGRGVFGRPTKPVYDEFGSFLTDGVEVFRLSETRTLDPNPGSAIDKDQLYSDFLSRLVFTGETFNSWSTKIIVGDYIRTKFSPLTLDLAALNGMRWDLESAKHKFSFLLSRRDRPIFENSAGSYINKDNLQGSQKSATYLLGGHWRSNIGALKFGVTYADQFRIDTLTKRGGLRGVIPKDPNPIDYVVVKVADDSPRDGQGGRVFGIDVYVDGEKRDDIVPVITRHNSEDPTPRGNPNIDALFPRPIPPYVQFSKGEFTPETFGDEGFLDANGTEYLLFWYEVPKNASSVEFEARIADDYRLSLSEVFARDTTISQASDRNRATYFQDVVRTSGKVSDLANFDNVRFEYGRATALAVYGLQLGLEYKGVMLRGEYARSIGYFQYPALSGSGKRHTDQGDAFYINFVRSYGPFSFGSEYFNISPDYTTSISIQSNDYLSYTSLEPAQEPMIEYIPHGNFDVDYNNTIDMDLVDDNDDKDPYPDNHFLSGAAGFVDLNGVYPGLDRDLDGRVDTDENANGVPDYLEPFLLYYIEPEEFDYGDDMNNNGVIDIRENDNKPDYPYDRDLKGYHVFTTFKPRKDLKITVGRLDAKQIAEGGVNKMNYFKFDYLRYVPLFGEVRFVNFLKDVGDNIADDVYRYTTNSRVGASIPFVEDQLWMRNSMANTAFLDLRFFEVRNLNIVNKIRYDYNSQRSTPGSNILRSWALTSKIDYTFNFQNLRITPMLKYMTRKLTVSNRNSGVLPSYESMFYPILRVDYQLTPRTAIKLGAQGFPFLESRFRDLSQERTEFTSEDYVAMISNFSQYGGYELSTNIGYAVKIKKFDNRGREFEDEDYSLVFVRVFIGLSGLR